MEGTVPRVDQRALRFGTNARFAQLIVLLVIATSTVSANFIDSTDSTAVNGCMLAAGVDMSRADNVDRMRAIVPQQAAFDSCLDRFASIPPWWTGLSWIGLMLVVAVFLFAVIPAWRTRPGRVVPLDPNDAALHQHIAQIAMSVGARRMPRLYQDRAAGSANAFAFGSDRRPILLLDAGLLLLRNIDPDRFTDTLRHELAHVANRDITITYATIAIWRAFLLVSAVPFLVWFIQAFFGPTSRSPVLHSEDSFLFLQLLFVVVLSALLFLARSEVLRTREMCADIASHSDSAALARHVSEPLAPVGRVRAAARSFVGLWRVHPPWELRVEALGDPAKMLPLAPLPMFLIGLATGMIGSSLDSNALLQFPNGERVQESVAMLPAVLVAGTGGMAVWNAVMHAPADRRRTTSAIIAGIFAGAGLATAAFTTDYDADFRWVPENLEFLALPVLAGAALFWWIAQCARLWHGSRTGRVGIAPMLLVLLAAAFATATGLTWWFHWGMVFLEDPPYSFGFLREQYMSIISPGVGDTAPTTQSLATGVFIAQMQLVGLPFAYLGAVAIWVVPLLSGASRRRAVVPVPEGTRVHMPERWPLGRVILVAVFSGLLSWGVMFVIALQMPRWQVELADHRGLITVVLTHWTLFAWGVAAVSASIVAGSLVRRYRLLAALVAAHLAVLIGVAGTFVITSAIGCVQQPFMDGSVCIWIGDGVWLLYKTFIGPVLLATTVVAAAMAAMVATVGRLTSPRGRRVQKARVEVPGRRRTRVASAATVALCAVMIGVASGADADPMRLGDNLELDASEGLVFLEDGDSAPSPEIRAMQMAAWGKYGGSDVLERFSELPDQMAAALDELAMAETEDLTHLGDVCAEFTVAVQDALAYFQIPEPEIQSLWQTTMDEILAGSRDCTRGIASEDAELVSSGIDSMYESMLMLLVIIPELQALLDDYPE